MKPAVFDWLCTEFNILEKLIQFEVFRQSTRKGCTSVLFSKSPWRESPMERVDIGPPPTESAAAPYPRSAGTEFFAGRQEVLLLSELLLPSLLIQFKERGARVRAIPTAPPPVPPPPAPTLADLSTPLLASLGQRQIKPSFLPGVNHADLSAGREEEKTLAKRNALQTGAQQMCLASRAQPWPSPESRSSAPRPCNCIMFSPVQSSFYRKKIFLKKYKLLLCKIKVPISGASG